MTFSFKFYSPEYAFALGDCALCLTGQTVGNLLKLLLDMEDIAVAGRFRHRRFLPCPESTAAIGNRIVWLETLRHRIQKMLAPGIFVSMVNQFQKVAVGRGSINANQHRFICLKDFIE